MLAPWYIAGSRLSSVLLLQACLAGKAALADMQTLDQDQLSSAAAIVLLDGQATKARRSACAKSASHPSTHDMCHGMLVAQRKACD